jgi:hypothetical protein
MAQLAREHNIPAARTKKVPTVGQAMLAGNVLGDKNRAMSPNVVGTVVPTIRNWAGQSSRRVFQSSISRARPSMRKSNAVIEDINPGRTPAAWSAAETKANR